MLLKSTTTKPRSRPGLLTTEPGTPTPVPKIFERFPVVFVDHSLKNPDLIACHYICARREVGFGVETYKQVILLNI